MNPWLTQTEKWTVIASYCMSSVVFATVLMTLCAGNRKTRPTKSTSHSGSNDGKSKASTQSKKRSSAKKHPEKVTSSQKRVSKGSTKKPEKESKSAEKQSAPKEDKEALEKEQAQKDVPAEFTPPAGTSATGEKSKSMDAKTNISVDKENKTKTNMDGIPSIDAEGGNTGENTLEVRREAAALKPKATVLLGKPSSKRAKANDLPTMDDVASDWDSGKGKAKTKDTSKRKKQKLTKGTIQHTNNTQNQDEEQKEVTAATPKNESGKEGSGSQPKHSDRKDKNS
ncbi:unnamed protein product [Bursaphelenchus okinawaensis]|uniref:Uncharacterized protein n=1 Tax=Bursaphelenchus okinawaensis TaxID=465554 RepID=A0A811L8J0_9BILA|nr:unnamed protein product [Bursaphelenchus okinawaensis]CAG9117940.1 unnamed protein product [Bursaphelenchus okinawaensis]